MYFHPNELNKCYYDIVNSVEKNKFTVLYGGRNSAKSYSVSQWIIKTLFNEHDANAVWYRKIATVLKEKAYNPIKKIIDDKKFSPYCDFLFYSNIREITFPHGNRLMFDFAQDGKVKGIANVRYIIIDEIDELTKKDFIDIVGSYRGDEKIRFIFMFNPVSKDHWLYDTFFLDDNIYKNRAGCYHYTVHDNKFATSDDILNLQGLKDIDENEYKVNYLGEWGSITVDNPFIDKFDNNTHALEDSVKIFPNYPFWVSWDFGGTESCTISQTFMDYEIGSDLSLREYFNEETNAITFIKEWRSKDAINNVVAIIQDIVKIFGKNSDYIICGDTAGAGNSVHEMYGQIRNTFEDLGALNLSFPQRVKPSHRASRAITNWCLTTYGSNFKISNKNCPKLLDDLRLVRVNFDGRIDKEDCISNNKGHVLDALRYKIYTSQIREFMRRSPYISSLFLNNE